MHTAYQIAISRFETMSTIYIFSSTKYKQDYLVNVILNKQFQWQINDDQCNYINII